MNNRQSIYIHVYIYIYIYVFSYSFLFSRISYLIWDQVVNQQVSEVCQPATVDCSLTVDLFLLSLKQGPDLFRGAVII